LNPEKDPHGHERDWSATPRFPIFIRCRKGTVKYCRSSTLEGNRGESLTNCDECDAPLAIPGDAIQGEIVSCKECGATYEVKKDEASGLITLKTAEKEQEDWGE